MNEVGIIGIGGIKMRRSPAVTERVEKMTRKEMEERYQELLERHNLTSPKNLSADEDLPETPIEEMEELECIKERLGSPLPPDKLAS
jgi:hypothetical protein